MSAADVGRVSTGQALVADACDDPSRDFIVKRWKVNVLGYGDAFYEESTRGSAMARAWRCDAFSHLTFGEFLKIARCTRDHALPDRWGDPITVEGRPAFFLENNRQYVRFAYPGRAAPSNAHPYDVLPVEYRPDTYRDRDSDGGDSAGLDGIAHGNGDPS